jgi:hypothetical protein
MHAKPGMPQRHIPSQESPATAVAVSTTIIGPLVHVAKPLLLGHLWMWAGTAVLVLPFPAAGTDLTGQKMASRQATVASSVFRRPEEEDRHPSSLSLCEWQAGPSGQ